jgi:hypothetical protein
LCKAAICVSGNINGGEHVISAKCVLEHVLKQLWSARLVDKADEPFYQLPFYVSVDTPGQNNGTQVYHAGESWRRGLACHRRTNRYCYYR